MEANVTIEVVLDIDEEDVAILGALELDNPSNWSSLEVTVNGITIEGRVEDVLRVGTSFHSI